MPTSIERRRPLRRSALAVLCAAGLVLPTILGSGAAAQSRDETQDRLDHVEDDLRGAKRELHDIERDHGLTESDLARINAKRADLAAELAILNDDLSFAQSELERREAALARTDARITTMSDRIAATKRKLSRSRHQFAERARASYMHGRTSYADVMLDLKDFGDVADSVTLMRAVVASDRARVERVDGLERELGATLEQLELLSDRQADERREAAVERDRVAGIVAEREAVQAQADAEAAQHEAVLAQLDSDRRAYEDKVAALEQQSNRLEADLRAIARAEARRQAREEARARREARRVARAAREAAQQREREQEPAPEPAPDPAPEPASSSGFIYPVSAPVTSPFGYRVHPIAGTSRLHTGVDFGAVCGTPILASAGGTVYSAGWLGGYGNAAVVVHAGGLSTLYAHQTSLAVGAGQSVSQGDVVGYVGSTGFSTGCHLHFEVRVNGAPVDPMGYL